MFMLRDVAGYCRKSSGGTTGGRKKIRLIIEGRMEIMPKFKYIGACLEGYTAFDIYDVRDCID